jgi:hypothetical protein
MSSLIDRATAIRESARAAGDSAAATQTLKRAVELASELTRTTVRIERVVVSRAAITGAGVTGSESRAGANDAAPVRDLAAEARDDATADVSSSVIGSTARDLGRAADKLVEALEAETRKTWQEWTQGQLRGVGAAVRLLEKPLAHGPFSTTIERARAARTQLEVLSRRELPTAADVQAFVDACAVLADANGEIEQQVPRAYRSTLVRCASPDGVRPTELPEGFVEWIERVGAAAYFRVTLSS